MITPNVKDKQHEEMIKKLEKEQRKFAQKEQGTGLAIGDFLRMDLNLGRDEIFKIMDEKMYLNKNKRKEQID